VKVREDRSVFSVHSSDKAKCLSPTVKAYKFATLWSTLALVLSTRSVTSLVAGGQSRAATICWVSGGVPYSAATGRFRGPHTVCQE
jgi:hypothetical protein